MNYLILGSGFGLYGYLPAVLSNNANKVFLEKKYKKIISKRKELSIYKKNIVWINKYIDFLNKANYLIVAKRPIDQFKLVNKILNKENKLKKIFLEKPIGKNPNQARKILKILKKKKINASFGFLFEFTEWYKKIQNFLNKNKKNLEININWSFRSFFLKKKIKSWKNNPSEGGGIINYYGIHFIKLINELGYKIINFSKIENKNSYWLSSYKKNKDQILILKINIYSKKDEFNINLISKKNKLSINLLNPFTKKNNYKKKDNRIKFLIKYLKYEANKKTDYKKLYDLINFWDKIVNFNNSNKLFKI